MSIGSRGLHYCDQCGDTMNGKRGGYVHCRHYDCGAELCSGKGCIASHDHWHEQEQQRRIAELRAEGLWPLKLAKAEKDAEVRS